jgi:ABC-type sugar transport system ATPase subunit
MVFQDYVLYPHMTVGDVLVCADCSRTVLWHSDEAGEWPTVDDRDRLGTVCSDCYRKRYGEDEASQFERQTRADQQDERAP